MYKGRIVTKKNMLDCAAGLLGQLVPIINPGLIPHFHLALLAVCGATGSLVLSVGGPLLASGRLDADREVVLCALHRLLLRLDHVML